MLENQQLTIEHQQRLIGFWFWFPKAFQQERKGLIDNIESDHSHRQQDESGIDEVVLDETQLASIWVEIVDVSKSKSNIKTLNVRVLYLSEAKVFMI